MSGQNYGQKIPKPIYFVSNVIMEATTKAVKSKTRNSWSFLNDFNPLPWEDRSRKHIVLVYDRCCLGPHATAVSDFFIIIDFFKCHWACLLQRSLRNICVHGRHGYCLIVIIPRSEITKVEEELQISLKVFVQESIKYGVDTGGYHCC